MNVVTNQSNVGVIPRVVVYQCSPIAHAGYLISVIPPGHDTRVFLSVLPQPVVGLAEVVDNLAGSTTQMHYLN